MFGASVVVGNFRYGAVGYVEEIARANPGLIFVGCTASDFDHWSCVKIINPRTGHLEQVTDDTKLRRTAEAMIAREREGGR
jgi:hypothetical protein